MTALFFNRQRDLFYCADAKREILPLRGSLVLICNLPRRNAVDKE
jgi:hypothetical protein